MAQKGKAAMLSGGKNPVADLKAKLQVVHKEMVEFKKASQLQLKEIEVAAFEKGRKQAGQKLANFLKEKNKHVLRLEEKFAKDMAALVVGKKKAVTQTKKSKKQPKGEVALAV
jgi:hypothetical protein